MAGGSPKIMRGKADYLTGPEASAHRAQVREKRCAACINRRYEGMAFGEPVLSCGIGLRWPKRGWCRGFELDQEGTE